MENLMDDDGRGKMTKTLQLLFQQNDCNPKCHICDKFIKLDAGFRLKPFCEKKVADKDGNKQSLAIMVCKSCDERERKLPFEEFQKAMKSLGYTLNDRSYYPPSDYGVRMQKSYDQFYKSIVLKYLKIEKDKDVETPRFGFLFSKKSEFEGEVETLEWRAEDPYNIGYREDYKGFMKLNPFHDLPYLIDQTIYELTMKKFHEEFDQLFPNETFDEAAKRHSREHAAYVKSLPPRGGCFVMRTGTVTTIITDNKNG
jgi:hypothetical protein